MRLINYLVISIVFHAIVVLLFWPPIDKKIEPLASKILIVSFTKESNTESEANSNQYIETITKIINEVTNSKSNVSKAEVESNFEQAALNTVADNIEPDVSAIRYYSVNEVDIKALPISNIDISMVSDIERTGLPIKLRIFVNVFGRIETIERLSNAQQDEEFLTRLEFLLKETAFLPAKKNGVNVDFVQDIELSI